MWKRLASPLLPITTGVLTVLSLAAQNADRVSWGDIWLPAGLAGLFGFIMWGVFWLIPFTRRPAALDATFIVLVTMLWTLIPFKPALPLMIGTLFIVFASAGPNTHKVIPSLTSVAVVACVLSLGLFAVTGNSVSASSSMNTVKLNSTPDIYFIVPDRFTSPAALREMGLNPDRFIQELRDRGFAVPEDNMSDDPYRAGDKASYTTRTLRYMASVLNMGKVIDADIPYLVAGSMVKSPEVAHILQGNGYEYHHIGSWFPETAYSMVADYNYQYPSYSLSSRFNGSLFAASVIDRSGFRALNYVPFLTDEARARTERGRQLYQIETFKKIAGQTGNPKFVFLHILLPHPDYYWKADGTPQDEILAEPEAYKAQVQHTMTVLLDLVDSIQDEDAIIIIQSDEGIAYLDNELNKTLPDSQWNGVLSAWRGIEGNINTRDVLKAVIEGLEE